MEWKALGEATIMKRGTSATKGIMPEGNIPVISGGRQPAYYCNISNRTGEVITVAGSGAGAGYVQYWNEPIFVCDAFSIQGNETLKTKYVYYVLTSIQEKIYSTKKVGGVPHVHISSIEKFEIPVPPLPVQEEIVRILDNFTELQAELQAELQKRKLQYNYYLDNLLNFNRGGYQAEVRWMKLGEVCEFRNGFAFKSNLFKNDGCPIIRITNISGQGVIMEDVKYFHMEDYPKTKMTLFEVSNGDILVAMSGATTGKIGIYKEDVTAYLNQRTGKFVPKPQLNNRFLYYFLLTKVNEMYRMSGGGAQPNLSSVDLKSKILIPLTSLAEQQKIVSILDCFDRLTTDLTQGLPAEIEKRRQQYEYYRDKLLTFKRKAA